MLQYSKQDIYDFIENAGYGTKVLNTGRNKEVNHLRLYMNKLPIYDVYFKHNKRGEMTGAKIFLHNGSKYILINSLEEIQDYLWYKIKTEVLSLL